MEEKFNKYFYDSFCGEDYSNVEVWMAFFGNVADKIIEIFSPRTVLDAGCANGYLVSALRQRGVEAWGLDISSYAIASAPEQIRPYLTQQSMTAPLPDHFPQRYDLAVTIEVLEHMFPEEGVEAIRRLCQYSDVIIFSSTPDDIDNRTHVNVQQIEYWAKEFSKHSFYRNLLQPMDFISAQALLFEKKEDVPNVIFDYENLIRIRGRAEQAKQRRVANVFFDRGSGFSDEEKVSFTYEGATLASERIPVPAGTGKVRLDVIEGAYCAIDDLRAFTNLGELAIAGTNATLTDAGIHLFTHCDPGITFDVTDTPVLWIQFCADILILDHANELTFANGYIRNHEDAVRLAEELQGRKVSEKQLSDRLGDTESQLHEARLALSEKEDRVTALTDELKAQVHTAKKLSTRMEEQELMLEEQRVDAQQNDRLLSEEHAALTAEQEKSAALAEQLRQAEDNARALSAQLDQCQAERLAAIQQRDELQQRATNLEAMYCCISRSACWKMTKPLRVVLDLIKKPLRKIKWLRALREEIRCCRANGIKYAWRKRRERHRQQKTAYSYQHLYDGELLQKQRAHAFAKKIKFSITVPLYNTPPDFLKEMIQSVLDQTYANWELCLADGSDKQHREVGNICRRYAREDRRIRYKKLKKNLGISGNTNACLDMARGDYISLFDHDDLLHPSALYEVMTAIDSRGADFIYTDENTFTKTPSDAYCPHFKPDYAPDTLRTNNYICHFTSFRKTLLEKVGKFRPECDGSQDYDMVLRLTEQANTIVHIPKILYYWRAHAASVATDVSAKPYVITAAHRALTDHLARVGLKGTVEDTVVPSMYRIRYELAAEGLVSIVIPSKDHTDDLDKCLRSIREKTTYKNYEIVVVENNSTEQQTWDYYERAQKEFGFRLVVWKSPIGEFNYSAINNFGVRQTGGEYVILLNNDTEIISPSWIEEMLMFAQRSDVGAVGAKLYYPDNTIQHAGIGIGLLTLAGHYHRGFPKGHPGYMGRLIYAHNVSAVTAACMMIPRRVWEEVGGLDETFKVAFNDVDLCMRIRKAGYLIVFTPFAELYHYESKSRGLDSAPEKRERFVGEVVRFQQRWHAELTAGDPYYNPNFSLETEDFRIK